MAEASQGITYEVLDETAVVRGDPNMISCVNALRSNREIRDAYLAHPDRFLELFSNWRAALESSFDRLHPVLSEVVDLTRRIIPELFPDEHPSDGRFKNFFPIEDDLFFDLVCEALFPPNSIAHVLARDAESGRAVGHLRAHVGRLIGHPSIVPNPEHPFVGGNLSHAFVDPKSREQGVFRGLMDRAVDFVSRRVPAFQHLDHVQGVHGDTFLVTLNAHPAQTTFPFLAGEGGFFRRYGFENVGRLSPDHPESGLMLADLEFFEGAFPVRPAA